MHVIDADGHILEPAEGWERYLPARYREHAPRWVVDSQGRPRRMIGSRMQPPFPMPRYDTEPVPGASDPRARLADMDADGISIGVIYPSAALHFAALDDAHVVDALCRAYNDWISEFCSTDPGRLKAAAVVPQLDIPMAIAETRRAVSELGLASVMLRPNPIGGRTLDNPAFDPLWSLLEELDVPLVLHEATTMNVPQAGLDRYDNYLYLHAITHPHEHQMACLSLICGQVLQRHPRLRVAFVESGCGWVPYWLERMEQHIDYWGHASLPLALRPTEFWQRQCFVSPFADETTVPAFVELLGADTLVYTTDYPYPYPGRDQMVSAMRDRGDVAHTAKQKILRDNALRLYGW